MNCASRLLVPSVFGLGLLACSPTLDWREARFEGASLLFPCKPASESRELVLADASAKMTLHACSAAGVTYALGAADLVDPVRTAVGLTQMLEATKRHLNGATDQVLVPLSVAGSTPYPQSARVLVTSRLPDGSSLQQHTAIFARGTRVYQLSMIGRAFEVEAVETFFGSIRLAD